MTSAIICLPITPTTLSVLAAVVCLTLANLIDRRWGHRVRWPSRSLDVAAVSACLFAVVASGFAAWVMVPVAVSGAAVAASWRRVTS